MLASLCDSTLFCLDTAIDKDDEVILFDPSYETYEACVTMARGVPVSSFTNKFRWIEFVLQRKKFRLFLSVLGSQNFGFTVMQVSQKLGLVGLCSSWPTSLDLGSGKTQEVFYWENKSCSIEQVKNDRWWCVYDVFAKNSKYYLIKIDQIDQILQSSESNWQSFQWRWTRAYSRRMPHQELLCYNRWSMKSRLKF